MNATYKAGAVCAAAVILTASLAGCFASGRRNSGELTANLRTVSLEKGDLIRSVSATGTVYSAQSTDVYSSLSYPVDKVYVSVGDQVVQGDILAELDSAGLEAEIAQRTQSVSNSQAVAQQNLLDARQNLETYRRNIENHYDASLVSAQSAVDAAELDLQSAELEVQSARIELNTARNNLRDARNGSGEYEERDPTDAELRALRTAVAARETSLEKVQTVLEKAHVNLEQARINLEAAQVSSRDTLLAYESKVKTAELNANFSDQWIAIQRLQDDLERCTVTAPVSGTVTAVQAAEGASGNGLLFVIQDTRSLKIVTNIKEYDIGTVQVGDRVVIKSDAADSQEYTGVLSKIAPTSTLTAKGGTAASTDAEYEAEILVSTGFDQLQIGMNTRLSIVVEERRDVYSVPYEAVVTDEMGRSYIYLVDANGDAPLRSVPVKTGMETDLYVEISGGALTEGLVVAKNAAGLGIAMEPADLPGLGGAPSEAANEGITI